MVTWCSNRPPVRSLRHVFRRPVLSCNLSSVPNLQEAQGTITNFRNVRTLLPVLNNQIKEPTSSPKLSPGRQFRRVHRTTMWSTDWFDPPTKLQLLRHAHAALTADFWTGPFSGRFASSLLQSLTLNIIRRHTSTRRVEWSHALMHMLMALVVRPVCRCLAMLMGEVRWCSIDA
jgi:hypothetical protein